MPATSEGINLKLGDRVTSELLIEDLYVKLRRQVLKWAKITHQTPQARMGYIGQHLVSVVTGYPGGKSGARGYDLILPEGRSGEIKTSYRVDQLSSCLACTTLVSSVETQCSVCGNTEVERKDDSKWLLAVKTDRDFEELLDPFRYYFVLFEFDDVNDASNDDINAYIWEVDPHVPGFAYGLIDYKLNIQSKSRSKAAFNLWPWKIKFYLMRPRLIYQSVIDADGVRTLIFPNDPEISSPRIESIPPLRKFTRATTLTLDALNAAINSLGGNLQNKKPEAIDELQRLRSRVSEEEFADLLASSVYLPLIGDGMESLPRPITTVLDKIDVAQPIRDTPKVFW